MLPGVSRQRLWSAAAAVLLVTISCMTWSRVAQARDAGAGARQTSPPTHTVSVSGHGQVTATPDMATLTVAVQTKGSDARSALSSNAEKMAAVIEAVKGQSVPESHIQTTGLSVYRDAQSDAYVATHALTVRVDSVNKVGAVLDAAVAAGANNSWGVQFGLKDVSALHAAALQNAVADARKRADAIAGALGVTINGVSSASETSYNSVPPIRYGPVNAPPAAAPSTPVQPGELSVTADLNVTFAFG